MTLLLLATLALGPAPIPLEHGFRWVYQHNGAEASILEVEGTYDVGDKKTTMLRVTGASVWWTSGALLVVHGKEGLVQHGYLYGNDELFGDDEPPKTLIPAELKEGATWTSHEFRARVVKKERVTVPAGTYDAWKIEYVLTAHLGTEADLHVWVTPGVGIVRFDRFQESTRGVKTPYEKPEMYVLSRAYHPKTTDFGGFPKLKISLTAKARINVGEAPGIRASVRNLAPQTTYAIPCLDASDVGWRYPKYTLEILDASGTRQEPEDFGRCGNMNVLGKNDFWPLRPGETLNPFGAGTFGHYMLHWKPQKPGVYKIRLTLDQSGKTVKEWSSELDLGALTEEAKKKLAELPRGKYHSDWVTVTVR